MKPRGSQFEQASFTEDPQFGLEEMTGNALSRGTPILRSLVEKTPTDPALAVGVSAILGETKMPMRDVRALENNPPTYGVLNNAETKKLTGGRLARGLYDPIVHAVGINDELNDSMEGVAHTITHETGHALHVGNRFSMDDVAGLKRGPYLEKFIGDIAHREGVADGYSDKLGTAQHVPEGHTYRGQFHFEDAGRYEAARAATAAGDWQPLFSERPVGGIPKTEKLTLTDNNGRYTDWSKY